jgi:hypothetical protein
MTTCSRDELEAAFIHYWRCGAVGKDWDAKKQTRRDWGTGPECTRGGPSYAERRPAPRR